MRSIDHYVHATASLEEARARYRALGFTVAPVGVHPFGTHNANMYFRDGPMVESLTMEEEGRYARAVRDGNTFVANDAAFRARRGAEGFSHIVLSSDDADADHAAFAAAGVSGGDLVAFTRQFEQPDGSLDTVSARLAFATHPEAPSGFYFTCQDIIIPDVDRSDLLDHPNGALGVVEVVSCAREPLVYADFLENLIGAAPDHREAGHLAWQTANGRISVMTPALLKLTYGVELTPPGDELWHCGLVFAVSDLAQTRACLGGAAGDSLPVVHPAPQADFFFGFVESRD